MTHMRVGQEDPVEEWRPWAVGCARRRMLTASNRPTTTTQNVHFMLVIAAATDGFDRRECKRIGEAFPGWSVVRATMAEGNGSAVAKAVGIGAVGVLAALGKFADDCGRAGLRAGGAADDLARVGAKPLDDLTHLKAGRPAGVADDLARTSSPAALADELGPGARSADLSDEALKTAAEEGSLTLLDVWLSEQEEDEESHEAPNPMLGSRPVRVLWTFAPLAVDSLGAYLGHAPDQKERAGHQRFSDSAGLVIKPVFSELPVSKSFGLRESLKAFSGYTRPDDPTRLRLWEGKAGDSVLITQLLSACLLKGQECMVLACTKSDLNASEPCLVVAKNVVKRAREAASSRAALKATVSARNAAKRHDLVIHTAAIVEGRPRFMHSVAPATP